MRWIVLAALALFVIQTALKALRAPWQVDDFPEALAVKVELLPWLFPLHMIAGGLVLLLIPATLVVRRHARWQRPLGRVTALVVLVAGLTAFPVALIAPVTPAAGPDTRVRTACWRERSAGNMPPLDCIT